MKLLFPRVILQRELDLATHINTSKIPNTVQAHHAATHLWETNTVTLLANVSTDLLIDSMIMALLRTHELFFLPLSVQLNMLPNGIASHWTQGIHNI